MQWIHVGAAVLNQTPLDWRQNQANIEAALAEAADRGVSLLVLPELAIPGYGCDDAYQSPGVQRASLDILFELAPKTAGRIVALGLPIQYRKALFNCVAVVADGEVLGFVAKRFLAGDGLYYEPRWFKPWPQRTVVTTIERGGRSLPDRRPDFFSTSAASLGRLRDLRGRVGFARAPGPACRRQGCRRDLQPKSASHFAFGKQDVRRRLRDRGVARLRRHLPLREPARQRGGAGRCTTAAG